MLMRSSDKSEWNFRCNEPKHDILVWIWCILSTSIVGTIRWWCTHGESYSSKISQTSIEESFPRAPGTRSRSSSCFHVVVSSFRSRPRFRERASFSPLFRQIMHINSLFLVVHLCELVQKRSQDPHAPTDDKPLNPVGLSESSQRYVYFSYIIWF